MDNFENVSYGNGQNNYFGAETSAELKEKLASYGKSELRGLASKVGINPNYDKSILRDIILKEFQSYKAKNSPIPAPKPMFAEASSEIKDMLESVGKIKADEQAKKKWTNKKKWPKKKNSSQNDSE
jgi:hypothetical protein